MHSLRKGWRRPSKRTKTPASSAAFETSPLFARQFSAWNGPKLDAKPRQRAIPTRRYQTFQPTHLKLAFSSLRTVPSRKRSLSAR
uniref:Uncharacterized protein n=1 Tax=Neospora caninum (strain Liverpool) TaxID=572307 RepID=A0A0F7UJ45_NEOCL|nr:TPA: hypothetical protein BN1204_056765 [Neospora caninum Liverpool]